MAIIFGSASKYLKDQERFKNRLSKTAIYLVAFILGPAVGFTITLLRGDFEPGQKIWIFVIFSCIFIYLCYKLLYAYSKNELFSKNYTQGSHGEDLIFAELNILPENFVVFRDVVFKKGNLDFIVVKPGQIFCIEVKSHKGKITAGGGILFRNGHPMERDFFKQTWKETKELKEFLSTRIGEIFIVPIIVFSNMETWVEIDPKVPQKNGIHILHGRMLKAFLHNYNYRPQNFYLPAVVECLKPYVKQQK